MTQSTHQIAIRARDNTRGAFQSIAGQARSAGRSIAGMVGTAVKLAASFFAVKGAVSLVGSTISELGRLSDIAMQTGTTTDEITRLTSALQVMGLSKNGLESVAKAMQYMTRATGATGVEGFTKTIEEISKIKDEAGRAQEAMKVFGRAGADLMPLIDAGDAGVAALAQVVDAMPAIPQAAADAGDAFSDAWTITMSGFKSVWASALSDVLGWVNGFFEHGIRSAASRFVAGVQYYAKLIVVSVYDSIVRPIMNFGELVGTFLGTLFTGGLVEAINAVQKLSRLQDIEAQHERERTQERVNAWQMEYDKKWEAAAGLDKTMDNLAKSAKKRAAMPMKREDGGTARSERISNSLVMGATQEALKLAVMGPQMSEQKKTNALLESIDGKLGKIEGNTDNIEPGEKLEEI